MATRKTLKSKIQYRIKRSKEFVFLPKDFADLAGYNQILRGLRELVADGLLVKVGKGLYVKARPSVIDGSIGPDKSMRLVAQQALKKLGVETCLTPYEKAYNEYRSTQVLNGFIIGVKKKNITRKIGFGKIEIRYQFVPDNVNDELYNDDGRPPFAFEDEDDEED